MNISSLQIRDTNARGADWFSYQLLARSFAND
jgi:hypothetical protein